MREALLHEGDDQRVHRQPLALAAEVRYKAAYFGNEQVKDIGNGPDDDDEDDKEGDEGQKGVRLYAPAYGPVQGIKDHGEDNRPHDGGEKGPYHLEGEISQDEDQHRQHTGDEGPLAHCRSSPASLHHIGMDGRGNPAIGHGAMVHCGIERRTDALIKAIPVAP